jgi:CheY-like chemotaxis protein
VNDVGTTAGRNNDKDGARRILILDDSEVSLQLQSALLGMAGFHVRTAAALAEFHALLGVWRPHVILTDLNMPEMDGATLCTQLRANPETAKIPIVLFSSASLEELADIAKKVGADAFLSKRGGYEDLPERMQELCAEILW